MNIKTRYGVPLAAACLLASPAIAQSVNMPNETSTVAAVIPVVDAPPAPLAGVAASYATPLRDASGGYVTPNRDLSPEETVWHLRVALNVAALGCRDATERETVANYNALLANARTPLAAAQTGMMARYRAKFGTAWQARNDDQMTKLYNFFAQTVAHDEFCATAKTVLRDAAAVEPADLTSFAAAALPQLEAPFLAFFVRYDAYRGDLAAWQARHAPRVVIATAAVPQIVAARP